MGFEHWFYTIPLRVRSLFCRSRVERELDEELQIHVEQLIQQGTAIGKTRDEARYAALGALGGLEQRKEECRDTRRVRWIEELLDDTRYAARTLTKTLGFAVIVTLVLALGIGANTAIFTIVNSVLLRALPFPEPTRLSVLSYKPKDLFFDPGPIMVDSSYLEFRRHNQSFESLSTVNYRKLTLTGSGDPVVVVASEVGPEFLRVLRVHPAMGRDFLPEGQSDPDMVLLSDKLWRSRFGGNKGIFGRGITLDGVSYSVAGIMPSNFTFRGADLWIRTEIRLDPHNAFFLPVIGRLKPGVSFQEARAELQTFAATHLLDSKDKSSGPDAHILPLKELFVADVRKLLLMFAGAVAFVFLIACANFANLLLIRGAGRQSEIAVRSALGASHWRLVRQLLAESTLLSLAGACVGILLSVAGVRALLALLPPDSIPRSGEIRVDAWVLLFTLTLSLITGVVFGLAPALHVTRRELRESISEGGRGFTGGSERLRSALVMAEIALALVLLIGAGLLLKSFVRVRSINPGFQSANILTLTLDLPIPRYPTSGAMRRLDEHILASLALLPGAKSVAAVSFLPMDWGVVGDFQLADGRHLPDDYRVNKPVVSAGYFPTMGIGLINGREFSERDDASTPGVVVISDSVAHRLWPAGNAIGKRISMEDHPKAGDWLTIVGVVTDVRQQSLTKKAEPTIYQSYKQMNERSFLSHMSFAVQTNGNPLALASSIRTVIRQLDPDLPTQSITTMEAILAETMTESRSQTRLLGIFSLMALSLAAIGIYGVLACSVAERTHEIGIRMAVGARERDVLWMVFRRTLALAGSGVLMGVVGAFALTRVLTKFLFEVTPTDPLTFAGVTGILVIVALCAAWLPAQRAARVYPLLALRHE